MSEAGLFLLFLVCIVVAPSVIYAIFALTLYRISDWLSEHRRQWVETKYGPPAPSRQFDAFRKEPYL